MSQNSFNPNAQEFDPTGLPQTLFPANSRYHGLGTETIVDEDGNETIYLKRRFVPNAKELEEVQLHSVIEGDRLDNLAFKYLGDPELFWRICDGNSTIDPQKLTEEIGAQLRITLPQGMGGINA